MHSNLAGASSSAVPQIEKGNFREKRQRKEREKYMEKNIEKNEERAEQARENRAISKQRIIEENGE